MSRSAAGAPVIDPTARLFNREHITVGAGSRIDSFALITAASPGVVIGRRVHIAAGVYIFGTAGVFIDDFVNLSGRVMVYSTSDDFTDGSLAGPLVPHQVRNVAAAPVRLEAHALIGAGSVILPGVTLGRGCSVGALSLVNRDVEPGDVVAGAPIRTIGRRDQARLADLEARLDER